MLRTIKKNVKKNSFNLIYTLIFMVFFGLQMTQLTKLFAFRPVTTVASSFKPLYFIALLIFILLYFIAFIYLPILVIIQIDFKIQLPFIQPTFYDEAKKRGLLLKHFNLEKFYKLYNVYRC